MLMILHYFYRNEWGLFDADSHWGCSFLLRQCHEDYCLAFEVHSSNPSPASYANLVENHNNYVQQLHATNGMVDQYYNYSLPQLLQVWKWENFKFFSFFLLYNFFDSFAINIFFEPGIGRCQSWCQRSCGWINASRIGSHKAKGEVKDSLMHFYSEKNTFCLFLWFNMLKWTLIHPIIGILMDCVMIKQRIESQAFACLFWLATLK